MPPFYYRYDQGFMHWLYWTDKTVEFISDQDVEAAAATNCCAPTT